MNPKVKSYFLKGALGRITEMLEILTLQSLLGHAVVLRVCEKHWLLLKLVLKEEQNTTMLTTNSGMLP